MGNSCIRFVVVDGWCCRVRFVVGVVVLNRETDQTLLESLLLLLFVEKSFLFHVDCLECVFCHSRCSFQCLLDDDDDAICAMCAAVVGAMAIV